MFFGQVYPPRMPTFSFCIQTNVLCLTYSNNFYKTNKEKDKLQPLLSSLLNIYICVCVRYLNNMAPQLRSGM